MRPCDDGIHSTITVQLHKHNSWASGIMLLVTEMRKKGGKRETVRVGGGGHGLMRTKERAIVFFSCHKEALSLPLHFRLHARYTSLCLLLLLTFPPFSVGALVLSNNASRALCCSLGGEKYPSFSSPSPHRSLELSFSYISL